MTLFISSGLFLLSFSFSLLYLAISTSAYKHYRIARLIPLYTSMKVVAIMKLIRKISARKGTG